MFRKLALASLSALVALTLIAPVSALTFSASTPVGISASAAATAAAGTMEYFFCADADVVAFTAVDNADGTWTFNFVDVGNPACAWAETGAAISASGSPETGFSGLVSSGPWTISGNDFSAHLTVSMDLGSTISGAVSGVLA